MPGVQFTRTDTVRATPRLRADECTTRRFSTTGRSSGVSRTRYRGRGPALAETGSGNPSAREGGIYLPATPTELHISKIPDSVSY